MQLIEDLQQDSVSASALTRQDMQDETMLNVIILFNAIFVDPGRGDHPLVGGDR